MKLPQGWKRPFDDPIPLPRGRQLVTLEDAAKYTRSWRLPNSRSRNGRPLSKPCCYHGGAHWRHESIEPRLRPGV